MSDGGGETSPIRINKYLSLCGVTSRRGADKLIERGSVTVNDETVTTMGVVIDTSKDVVRVKGTLVEPVTRQVYVVLNKPKQVMTTLFDPFKRKTVLHLLKNLGDRVYPVGRLDYDTEGVLLLTNDGDLAYRLAHPRYQVAKVYEARVDGAFTTEAAARIKKGIKLEDGATGHASVAILGKPQQTTRIRLTLTEGRKREVKQLCKAVGHPVKYLRRISFAGVTVARLGTGQWRELSAIEVKNLKDLVGLSSDKKQP